MKKSFWTKTYIQNIAINFLVYTISYQMMQYSTIYSIKYFNTTVSEAGMASGIFIIGSLISRFISGFYINIIGRKKTILIGAIIYSIGIILYFVAINYNVFIIVRFFHGVGFGIIAIASSVLAAVIIPKSKKGEGIGYFTLSMTLASAFGPFIILTLINKEIFSVGLYIAALMSIIIIVLTIFVKIPENNSTRKCNDLQSGKSIRKFISKEALPIGFIGFLSGICFSSVLSYIGIYAKMIGLADAAGIYFIVYGIASFISRPIIGKLFDRFGSNIIMYPALILIIISMFLTGIAHTESVLLLSAFLIGTANAGITAGGHTIAINKVSPNEIGTSTATFYALLELGYGIGPIILGNTVFMYGIRSLYFSAMVVGVIGMISYSILSGKFNH
ncbi:MFS transporter [Pectinatus frisingensis]|uniref:MFS transporter n=1 Tax=Pectinatus frisingensis TaxID=865 RepID=UPI0015F5D06D|nr:MFS transporter [Pectinatus frisingensis]